MLDTAKPGDQSEALAAEGVPAPAGGQVSPEELLAEQVATLERKLSHIRAWMSSVQAQVASTNPQLAKNARRLYVGGVPTDTTEEELYQFFAGLIASSDAAAEDGPALSSCKITPDKGYAFLELRSAEEASNATAFDGVKFKDSNLKIRRPSNYDSSAALLLGPVAPDPTLKLGHLTMCKTVVEDSWSKVFIGGLPSDWTDDQVKELLSPYGQLRSFNLVMDKATGKSKGYCFCEYEDDASVEAVVSGLHMKSLNRKMLTVKRALDGMTPLRSCSGGSESGSLGRRNSSGVPLGPQRDAGAAQGNNGSAAGGAYGRGGGGPMGAGAGGMLFPHQAMAMVAAAAAAAAQQQAGAGGHYPSGLPPPPHAHGGGANGWRGKPLGPGGPLGQGQGHPQQMQMHGHDAAAAAMASNGMVAPGMFGFGGYPQQGPPNAGTNMNGAAHARGGPFQHPHAQYGPGGGAPGGPPAGARNSPPAQSQSALAPAQASPGSSGQMYEAAGPPASAAPAPGAPGAGGGAGGGPHQGPAGFQNGPGPLPAISSLPGGVAPAVGQEVIPPPVQLYQGGPGAAGVAADSPVAQQAMPGTGGGGGSDTGAAPAPEAFSSHVQQQHHSHHHQQAQQAAYMAQPLASSYW